MLLKMKRDEKCITILDEANIECAVFEGKQLFILGTVYDSDYHQIGIRELFPNLIEFNKTFFSECRGAYSIVFLEGDCLRFFCDTVGISTLYYEVNEEYIVISDRANLIVENSKHKYHIDFCAWAEMLAFYYI